MGSMEKGFVHYCCVAKGGKILQSYSNNNGEIDLEMEKLAALCLEKAPQFHRWYSQTMTKRKYCFLMEDGFVYFAIAGEGIGNPVLLGFLEHYRDEFKKIAKRGSGLGLRLSWKGKGKGGMLNSNLNPASLQKQLVPVVHQLITSLQNVGQSSNGNAFNPCGGYYGGVGECGSSTKAPLLGNKAGKQEKKSKDHVIAMRGIELKEHYKSAERGLKASSGSGDTTTTTSPSSLQKDMSASMRRRSSPQSVRKKWCRLVQLVLAIDAAVCITLLAVWLVICRGIKCIR